MNIFRTTWFRFWVSPPVVAVLVFSLVQPGFAAALEVPSTQASYLAAGNTLSSYGLVLADGDQFSQVFYEYQGQQYVVTSDNRWKREVQSEGEYMVWQAETTNGWQIMLHHISTDEMVQISSGPNNIQPRLDASGPYVVWRGWTEDDWQIFLYDGVRTRQVTQGDVAWNADVENGVIVFNRQDAGGARRAIRYDIASNMSSDLKEGRLAMFPYFNNDGGIAFRAEDEQRAQDIRLAREEAESGDGGDTDFGLKTPHTLSEALNHYGITECPPEVRPVCGADGVSYINACVAFWAETAVNSAGVCEGEFINPTDPFSANHPLYVEPTRVAVNNGGGGAVSEDEESETQGAEDSEAPVEEDVEEGSEEEPVISGDASDSDDIEEDTTDSGGDNDNEKDAAVSDDASDAGDFVVGGGASDANEDERGGGGLLGFIGDLFDGDEEDATSASTSEEGSMNEHVDTDGDVEEDIIEEDPTEPEIVTEEEIVEELSGKTLIDEENIESGEEVDTPAETEEPASEESESVEKEEVVIEEEPSPKPEPVLPEEEAMIEEESTE